MNTVSSGKMKPVSGLQDVSIMLGTALTKCAAMLQGGELTYQWFKDGLPVREDTATSPVLAIDAPSTRDSGNYHVRVTNSAGTTKSIIAVVHIHPAQARHEFTRGMRATLSSRSRQRAETSAQRRSRSQVGEASPGRSPRGDAARSPDRDAGATASGGSGA